MYLKHLEYSIQIIIFYFYDRFISGSFIVDIGSIKSSLHNVFAMTGLGLLKKFLVLEIEKYDVGTKIIK